MAEAWSRAAMVFALPPTSPGSRTEDTGKELPMP